MFDARKLLEEFMGQGGGSSAGAGRTGSGGSGAGDLLARGQDYLRSSGSGGLAGGALAGGLAGLLLGTKGGRKIGKKALREALRRLDMEDEEDLMYAIGAAQITDHEVMEALVPGSTADFEEQPEEMRHKKQAISIRGLKPGKAYTLADCCHPVPGDRIVGLRRKGESVEVHNIQCLSLASGIDNDWLDLDWGSGSGVAIGRLAVVLYDRRGSLAEMANIVAQNHADVRSLHQVRVENPFAHYEIDVEVQDLAHLTRILSALRASDAVAQADRI